MSEITIPWLEDVAEILEDADYGRYTWGADVTRELVHAASIVTRREGTLTEDLSDSGLVQNEIMKVLARGWTEYDTPAELASKDDDGDQLNSLMIRFGFSGQARDDADDHAGRKLIGEAQENGEQVVWYNSADVPGLHHVSNVVIFGKKSE